MPEQKLNLFQFSSGEWHRRAQLRRRSWERGSRFQRAVLLLHNMPNGLGVIGPPRSRRFC